MQNIIKDKRFSILDKNVPIAKLHKQAKIENRSFFLLNTHFNGMLYIYRKLKQLMPTRMTS